MRKRVGDDSAWFEVATDPTASDASTTIAPEPEQARGKVGNVLRFVEPTPENRYTSCVPLMDDLEVAAVGFSDAHGASGRSSRSCELAGSQVDSGRSVTPDMFAATVVGRSMEPRIPEGSSLPIPPSRGRQQERPHRPGAVCGTAVDPETGERFTVKRYRSEKRAAADGPWRHVRITLEPLNPEFAPIERVAEDDRGSSAVDILAEFLDVLQPTPST